MLQAIVDSLLAIIVVVIVSFQLPVAVPILSGFVRGLHKNLLAAFVDGATECITNGASSSPSPIQPSLPSRPSPSS